MSGAIERAVVDTSVLVAHLRGDPVATTLLAGRAIRISCITEMEVLAYPRIREADLPGLRQLLKLFGIVELGPAIKTAAVGMRRVRALKLPDSIIAATALVLDVPLYSSDQRFMKVADRLDVRLVKLAR